MRKLCLPLYAIILLLCCPAFSFALNNATDCGALDVKADQRPASDGKPTEVSVGLLLIDVTGIEDANQTIAVDFWVVQEWTDERMIGFEGCLYEPDKLWTPKIDVVNSGRLFTRLQKNVEVLANGRIKQTQRYIGPLVFVYDAHRFPFDTQHIVITLLSEEYAQDRVGITIDNSVTGRNADDFNIPDWSVSEVKAQIVTKHIERLNRNYSSFEFHIPVERRSGFFIWKVILPLMLIVFMSWTVFWIKPSQVEAKISMSATSMLTLIAFQFAMAHLLPRLSYFTVMDRFLLGSTILVFLALIESITSNYLININKEGLALQVAQSCRWIFPAVFLLFSLIVFNF